MTGEHCMVASGHPLAVEAALQVLREGGSAVDAAIAADAVLGVVEPMATGIGGDLLAMAVQPDGVAASYNGTGRSPMALTVDLVKDFPGHKIPERHALSVTTPGVVRGWSDLHQRYGKLPWRRLFEPAVSIARDGFGVAPVAAREWALFDSILHKDAVCAALYRAGRPPRAGGTFCQSAACRRTQCRRWRWARGFLFGPARAGGCACEPDCRRRAVGR